MSQESDNLETARRYLRSIEEGASGDAMAFFAPNVVAQWYPHRLAPKGSTADLPAMRASAERGKQLMTRQIYEVRNAVVNGNQVALEISWLGILAVPFETIPAGGEMRAHFAMFLEFREGRIVAQRNYDCFEPW
jgi:ketosteroid isomerase-like protein